MGMNPRTLRPSASGFNPRSISGLAAWYDASDSSTLYQTDAGNVTAVSSPLDIAGCLCWYDASDATSITQSGGLVSQWNDKSGNNRHATASGSLRPTSGGSQNGLSVMQFTGTQAMTITGNFLQLQNVTMFAVASKNTNHYGGIISSAPINPEDSPVLAFYLTTIAFINRRQVVQTTTGNNVYRIISGQSEGTAQRAWADGVRGVDAVASASLHTSNTITKIGVLRTGDTADLNGNIAEIICYSGALSTADRASIEKYLAAKWGVAGVHAQATAANDPVGAWLDKSGNGRHVTQATAANRPIIASENGRAALTFDGTNDKLSHTVTSAIGADAVTHIAVARNNLTAQPTFMSLPSDLSSGNSGRPITRWESTSFNRVFVGLTFADVASQFRNRASRFINILAGQRDAIASGTHSVTEFFDGAQTAQALIPITTWSTASQVLAVGARDDSGTLYKGNVCEVLTYGRALSDAERGRIERYLAAKWGITLAPKVSNADAQDWINRVYANGGTVSATTATAVNTFCAAVESAGLRDRFYRLNLFCGGNLNACLVPLYRNWNVYAGRNLLTSGDNLTLSTWTKSGTTAAISSSERPFLYGPFASVVTANSGTGATPHVATTAGNYGYGTVTVSAYLKANGQNTVRVLLVGSSGMTFPGGGTVAYANINLSNGTVSNVLAGTTATATSVGSGWYRFAYTCANNGAGNMTIRYDVGDGSAYNPTGSESFFIWGIQSELGSSATGYDPYPLGNATDTNANFVSGDYVETGASGGLKGARASTKRLTTGVPASQFSGHNFHASAYECATSDASYDISLGAFRSANNSGFYLGTAGTTTSYEFSLIGNALQLATTPLTGHILGVQTGNRVGAIYRNGASASTTYVGGGNTPSDWSLATWDIAVFCWQNASGVYGDYSSARLGGYSVGMAMTAQQAAAYNTAMQAFQTALSRNV